MFFFFEKVSAAKNMGTNECIKYFMCKEEVVF